MTEQALAIPMPAGAILLNPENADGFLWLHADCLLSKWGFSDGDCIDNWWWDRYDESIYDRYPAVSSHDVLELLVQLALIPAVEAAGHTMTVYTIGTIHNPIRAETVDGTTIDHYSGDYGELLADISVAISPDLVAAAVNHLNTTALAASAPTEGA